MSEGSIENRSNFRPPTPVPTLSARLDITMEMLAKRNKWNLIAHGGMAVFTLICIAIVWWSVGSRLPLLQQDSEQMRQVNQLQNRVEQARLQENSTVEAGVLARTNTHEAELFRDRKAVVNWLLAQIDAAQQRGVSLRYTLGGVGQALITHHAMTVQLRLAVTRVGKQGSYAQLIALMDTIERRSVAVRINQISLHGGGQGVKTMDAQLTLWML